MHEPPAGWSDGDSPYRRTDAAEVMVFPSVIDIAACVDAGLTTGAQCGHPQTEGAFTGDICMKMLAGHGCRYVLCGHSERRQHHHESDEFIAEQVAAAINVGMIPILCIGETADERELGQAEEVVKRQLHAVLHHSEFFMLNSAFVIAYEPVWAIGSGKNATAAEAQEMHAFIRSLLPADIRGDLRIIYGGSVKDDNAAELIAQPDIDGFLVGGASLVPEEFRAIVATVSASV